MEKNELARIIDIYKDKQGGLIGMLEEIQKQDGFLSENTLRMVAADTRYSLVDVYGVATFYKAFSLKPRGKHLVLVCLGTACHVRGAPGIVGEFENQLGIKAGETTDDKEFTVETVNCLGACALGPTVSVDGHYFSHVSKKKVREIIAGTRRGLSAKDPAADRRIFPVKVSCPMCGANLLDPDRHIDGYPSIRVDVSINEKKSRVHLSSLYGRDGIISEQEIPLLAVTVFSCPHCKKDLPSYSICAECGTTMAALYIKNGTALEICTKRGCKGRMLNLDQIKMNKTELRK